MFVLCGAFALADTQEDFTDAMILRPGVTIVVPISEGIDSEWRPLGNYEFNIEIKKVSQDGVSFDWSMGYPADANGTRGIAAEDMKGSYRVSIFYPKTEQCIKSGYTNTVRISDALYKALKAGRKAPFELDGPDIPAGRNSGKVLPASIIPMGEDYVPVILDGKQVAVRTIKAQADNGWTYWVLDNAQFPMIIQGDGPFRWAEPRINGAVAIAAPQPVASARPKPENEVVRQLKEKGVATTYSVFFAFNSAVLKPKSRPVLNAVAGYLRENPSVKLMIEGHTDHVGSMQYNMKLSQRRAQSVKDYLVKQGKVASWRLVPKGYGFTKPVATNNTAKGRATNRRVVFRKIN